MKLTIPPAAAALRGVPFNATDAALGGRLTTAAEAFVREIVLSLRDDDMTPIAPPKASKFRVAFLSVADSLADDEELDLSNRDDRSYHKWYLKHMQFFLDLCASDAQAIWPDFSDPPATHAGVAHAAANQLIPDELVQKPSAATATKKNRKKSKTSTPASGGRSQSYTIKEDIACARAYFGVSCDAITGNDQRGREFWAKVTGSFAAIMEKEKMAESSGHGNDSDSSRDVEEVCTYPKRNTTSIRDRLSKHILPDLNSFAGLLATNPTKTGENEDIYLTRMCQLYAERDSKRKVRCCVALDDTYYYMCLCPRMLIATLHITHIFPTPTLRRSSVSCPFTTPSRTIPSSLRLVPPTAPREVTHVGRFVLVADPPGATRPGTLSPRRSRPSAPSKARTSVPLPPSRPLLPQWKGR